MRTPLKACPGKSHYLLADGYDKNSCLSTGLIKTPAGSARRCDQIISTTWFYLLRKYAVPVFSEQSQFHGNCTNERKRPQEPYGRLIFCFSLFVSDPGECGEKQKMNCVSMSESQLHDTAHPHLNAVLKVG